MMNNLKVNVLKRQEKSSYPAGQRFSLIILILSIFFSSCERRAYWYLESTTGPGPRSDFSMAYDPIKKVILLHGGFGPGTDADRPHLPLISGPNQSDTWFWNGTSWNKVEGSHLALERAAMVYDKYKNQMILFGGWTGKRTNETWLWSGSTWKQVTDSRPALSQDYALAFDEQRRTSLLFGGQKVDFQGGAVALGDTWEWNGTRWEQLHIQGPEPRWGHKMVYDEARKVILLFGGFDGSMYYNDTWLWDGVNASWSKAALANLPKERYSHAMVFNPFQGTVLLFAGRIQGDSPANDLWEWNGNDWSLVTQSIAPSPRYDHGMVYDVKREAIVLYGGYDGKQWLRDTWQLTYE